MKTKLLISVLIGLSCWLGGCAKTDEEKKQDSTPTQTKTINEIYTDGIRQVANFKIDNEKRVNKLLQDSVVKYYWGECGKPKIRYGAFEAHDAMTDDYTGISINTNKFYSEDQLKEILIRQFGIYYGLRNR